MVLLLPATEVSAEIIWRGDFETGNTQQWKGAPKSDAVKVVTEPVRRVNMPLRIDGTSAARRGKLDRIEFQHQPKAARNGRGHGTLFRLERLCAQEVYRRLPLGGLLRDPK